MTHFNTSRPLRTATVFTTAFAAVLLLLATVPLGAYPTYTVGGWIQARYSETLATGTFCPASFNDQRAFFYTFFNVDEHITAFGAISGINYNTLATGLNNPVVNYAWVQYKEKGNFLRAGLLCVPYGYENYVESSNKLITLERSQAYTVLFGGTNNAFTSGVNKGNPYLFIPSPSFGNDRGAQVHFQLPAKIGLDIAVVNGSYLGQASDSNNGKNIVSRLTFALPGGSVAASYYNGTLPTYNPTTQSLVNSSHQNVRRWGADIQDKIGPAITQAEYYIGKDGTIERHGGYALAAINIKKIQPYTRYDRLTYDTDAGTEYHRVTGGVNYILKGDNKFTVEYQLIHDDLNPLVKHYFGTQYQISF